MGGEEREGMELNQSEEVIVYGEGEGGENDWRGDVWRG